MLLYFVRNFTKTLIFLTVLFLINMFLAFLKSRFALWQLSSNHFGLLLNVLLFIFLLLLGTFTPKTFIAFSCKNFVKISILFILFVHELQFNQMYACFVLRVLYYFEPYIH